MPQDPGLFFRLSKSVFQLLTTDTPIPFEVVEQAENLFPGLYSRDVRLDQLAWKFGDLDKEQGLIFLCSLAAAGYVPIVEFGTFRGRTTYNLALNTEGDVILSTWARHSR